jgi:hypothetical protein
MLPTAIALGSGAEFRAPMAHAVIGGLITSTLLTLVVVPVMYAMLDRRPDALPAAAPAAAESGPPNGGVAAVAHEA